MPWMSGPTTVFRHNLLFSLLSRIKPSSILEIGFGNGDLLLKLNSKGYSGKGIDFSPQAVDAFRVRTQDQPQNRPLRFTVQVGTAENLHDLGEKFDTVIACEVLEHIDDDLAALRSWRELLTADGHLLLSVPAHMAHWGHNDDYAGHLRRYERNELQQKLEQAGFTITTICCYGYPFSIWAKMIGDLLIQKKIRRDASQLERTKDSGIHNVHVPLGGLFLNHITLYPFYLFQKLFIHTDKGIGYVVLAQRR